MTEPHNPVLIDPETCIHCMICDYVCPGDVIHQEPRADQLPVIAYPDECWYCGLCEQACPSAATPTENRAHAVRARPPPSARPARRPGVRRTRRRAPGQ